MLVYSEQVLFHCTNNRMAKLELLTGEGGRKGGVVAV